MPYDLSVPRSSGEPLSITLAPGEILFVLGANGAGKSGLMYFFCRRHARQAIRILAHRQSWFDKNYIGMPAAYRRDMANGMISDDAQPHSRWMDNHPSQRAGVAFYDLINSQNVRARRIADAMDGGREDLAQELAAKEAPLTTINELFRQSILPIQISVDEQDQVLASKHGSEPYNIAELSDGERNALVIAATILTVEPGSLVLVDEPERHLHRSIIAPLLTHLFAKRRDCAFVVSTHEVLLPVDNPGSRTLLVRSCEITNSAPVSWDVDLLPANAEVDDALKRDILGSRRRVILVEGTERSLDKPLYSLLFPGVSVVAKQSCRDVEHAVTGIRDAVELHWVRAFGIIDGDGRSADDLTHLRDRGVYAVQAFSVESIYYHPDVQRRVAERHASVTGEDATVRIAGARAAAIEAIAPHAQRLSERVAERAVREALLSKMPTRERISAGTAITFSIDVAGMVTAERRRIQIAINGGDVASIIARYPVRETPALDRIATRLGFQDTGQYEGAVRKLLLDDAGALTFVRTLFGTLPADVAEA
jgi:ABC-type cobalamin/Fe3+-siderophores transport system ATPase subunit